MSQNIAFVGVGRMGANMARRLKDCEYNVTAVNDVNREVASELAAEIGAEACENLADVSTRPEGTKANSPKRQLGELGRLRQTFRKKRRQSTDRDVLDILVS